MTSRPPYWWTKTMVFSHDGTTAILVSQNNETGATLVFRINPVGVELLFMQTLSFIAINLHSMLTTWAKTLHRYSLVNKNENVSTLTTRMFSWTPSKFFNSRRQTLNFIGVTSSAHTLVASWIFLGGSVWTTVRNTFGLLPENWKSKEMLKRWWTVEWSSHLGPSSV